MSILRLLDGNGYIDSGEILFNGQTFQNIIERHVQNTRQRDLHHIQEPMTSLNPVFTIEKQIAETFMVHQDMTKAEAAKEAVRMIADVQIPNPEAVVGQYPSAFGWNEAACYDSDGACMPS